MLTERLEFVPQTPQSLRAIVEGCDQFAQVFGTPAADGLREFFVSGDASADWLAQLAAATEADPWMHGFAVVHRADRVVIGACGFKGAPKPADDATEASPVTHRLPHVVEIGYGIVSDYCNQGFATEAAAALVNYATASGRVTLVRAHTLPEPNASTRVLAKCGFKKLGEVIDPDDGLVWRWERGIGN
jgi:RimJ/RimL family protein N-acetyltransferase